MKKNKMWIVVWITALLPAILLACFYAKLPAQVPTHWGFDGEVTYSGKATLWMFAGMSIAFAIMFTVLPKIDPRRRNYEKFNGYYEGFIIVLMLFLTLMTGITIHQSFFPGTISVGTVVTIGLGLLFIFLGNMMPKVKSNFFLGIKNPWTLSNSEVWNKTHRLAGYLWFIGGILVALLPFFCTEKVMFWALMAIIIVMTLVPTLMSYLWFREAGGRSDDEL